MGSWPRLLLLGTALLLACTLQAQTEAIYAVHVPAAGHESEPSLYSGPILAGGVSLTAGDWDVRIVLDPAKCQLYCTYRRKPDPFGRIASTSLLPLPSVSVSAFGRTVTVDPGRLRFPELSNATVINHERLYLPSRKLLTGTTAQYTKARHVSPSPSMPARRFAQTPSLVTRPLRV